MWYETDYNYPTLQSIQWQNEDILQRSLNSAEWLSLSSQTYYLHM